MSETLSSHNEQISILLKPILLQSILLKPILLQNVSYETILGSKQPVSKAIRNVSYERILGSIVTNQLATSK